MSSFEEMMKKYHPNFKIPKPSEKTEYIPGDIVLIKIEIRNPEYTKSKRKLGMSKYIDKFYKAIVLPDNEQGRISGSTTPLWSSNYGYGIAYEKDVYVAELIASKKVHASCPEKLIARKFV